MSTIKNRMGNVAGALERAGLRLRPPECTRARMLDEIRRLRSRLRRWPARKDIVDLHRRGKTPFHHKRYLREFRTIALAVNAAGGPPPAEITAGKLLDDIRRVTALALPDKPAGRAPSPHHFWKADGPMSYSVTAYQRRFDGGPDDWVRMAGGVSARLRSNDPKPRVAQRYRALYESLGHLPGTRDLVSAGIDFSTIARHYGSLLNLRLALGLPPTDGDLKRGEDLSFYKGRNVDVANILFRAFVDRRVRDYLPEQRWHAHRRFTVDFIVKTGRGDLFIEVDGYGGAGRPGTDYTQRTAKLAAYKRRRAELWVVSDKPYRPWYGRLVVLSELKQALLRRCSRDRRQESRDHRSLARDVDLHPRHVRWLVHRCVVRRDGLPSAEDFTAFIAAKSSDALLAIPQLAREVECGRRTIDNAIARGVLVPDVKSHRIVRFHRSRIDEIRFLLGERRGELEPATLLSESETARAAGISTGYLRRLVQAGKITADARVRERGRLRRRYSRATLQQLMSFATVAPPPPGWISLADFAHRVNRGRNSIRRLIDRGVVESVIARRPGFAESRGVFLDPEQLVIARTTLRRANRVATGGGKSRAIGRG